MTIVRVSIDGKIYQFPEEKCKAFILHPDMGLFLIHDKGTYEIGKIVMEIIKEKFGISKKEILELPEPCYDEDSFYELSDGVRP